MAEGTKRPRTLSKVGELQGASSRAIAALGALLLVTQLGFYLTTAALPLYLRDLGAAQDRIGLEVGLGNVTALLVTLAVGPGINRLGARLFLRAGALIYVIASLGMLTVPSEAAVAALRALQGVGTAAVVPGAYTLATLLLPGRQATALGTIGAINTVALAFGPALGIVLYTAHGATWLFLPATVAAGLGLLATLLGARGDRVDAPISGFGFDRRWWPALLANALATVYFGGILAYLPLQLQRLHGPNAGLFFTSDAVGVLLLRIPSGLLIDRAGSLLPKALGLLLTLAGIAVLALPVSLLTVIVSGALTGTGAGLLVTSITADLAALSLPGNRGTAMSLGTASFSLGIFVGSAVSGLVIGPGGFAAVLLFGGLAALAAVPFALMER